MRLYLRFDSTSVSVALKNEILRGNQCIRPFDDCLHCLEFDPVVFEHAYLLLGNSPLRYGIDLSMYLSGANDFFDRAPQSDLLSLAVGDTDFKRRKSEDLGVCIASLFMTTSFDIEWQTITQIPANSRISKFRPDFEGFTATDIRYLYEAKGRSSLSSIIDTIDKALPQVKDYPEHAERKLAIVTYISADERAFPSHTFILDPPAPNSAVDKQAAENLHLIKVFDFAGLTESKKHYVDLLRARFALASAQSSGTVAQRHENGVRKAASSLERIYANEVANMEPENIGDHTYLTRHLPAETRDRKYDLTLGVHTQLLDFALADERSKRVGNDSLYLSGSDKVSVYSDGTLLRVRTSE